MDTEDQDRIAQQESIRNMIRDYQLTFGTPHGRRVLTDLLVKNYFFSRCLTDEERIRRNSAVELLESAGILHTGTVKPIVEAMTNLAPAYPLITTEPEKR